MSVHQRGKTEPGHPNGGQKQELIEQLDELAAAYGNRFLLEAPPDDALPEHGMTGVDAMRLVDEELVLDGIPQRNLATFVTTWMHHFLPKPTP